MTRLGLTFAALLILASAAQAKDKKPIDPDKKLCRSEVPTGSRFVVRKCHTATEWASIDGTNAANGQATLNGLSRVGLATAASATR